MVDKTEVDKYQLILDNIEDLAKVIDILHTEVSSLKENIILLGEEIKKAQKNPQNNGSHSPMFG